MSTKTLIKTISVGAGGAASIDFTSIPVGYDDLILEFSGRSSVGSAQDNVIIAFNGSSANYSLVWLGAASNAPVSYNYGAFGRNHIGYVPGASATANVFGSLIAYFADYLSAHNKSISVDSTMENNSATQFMGILAGLWSQTAAINQLTLSPTSGTFLQYSVASLYGIKNS